ncbi:hypothetical protein [Alicyclobacillus sp. ALC3]|uniref:hypothetical protein n=1 Tax=Alicyclobacillus sp. ALC3 TaxID=2796143 RepID=UPI00237971FE|nr:hypothetical protein [Alicyclobacillus sp. ALC3]WDL95983.1 hypothetical protein JC200_16765 [Alicyclobacillus sp. ALC3]
MSDVDQAQSAELARMINRLAQLELDRVRHSSPATSDLDERMEKLLETVAGRQASAEHPDTVKAVGVPLPSPEELDGMLTRAIDELIAMYGPPRAAPAERAAQRTTERSAARATERATETQLKAAADAENVASLFKHVPMEDTDLDALMERVLGLLATQRRGEAPDIPAQMGEATRQRPVDETTVSTRREPDLLELAELVRQDLQGPSNTAPDSSPGQPRPIPEPADSSPLRVVSKPSYSFHVEDLKLEGTVRDAWIAAFNRLSDDQRILGWVAFHHGVLAAADHAYDPAFVASLATYYQATEKLCDKMGTLHAVRFHVDAQEGVMSFLPAHDDMWLMLFASAHTDVEQLLTYIPGIKAASEFAR